MKEPGEDKKEYSKTITLIFYFIRLIFEKYLYTFVELFHYYNIQ